MPATTTRRLSQTTCPHDYLTDERRLLEVVAVLEHRHQVSVCDALDGTYGMLDFAELDSGRWRRVERGPTVPA